MKIAFIGGGNMGQAMLSAIVSKGICRPEDISVCEPNKERCDFLAKDYGVFATDNSSKAIEKSDIIILAIKPQTLNEFMAENGGSFQQGQLVLSIIAGKSISVLKNGLKHNGIVRAMPNTPAQIGYGMTVWTATPEVTDKQKTQAASILGAMGKEIFVTDEDYIDIATAISGSGPAYVFLFMESLINAAQKLGMPADKAYDMVMQLMTGSVKYACNSEHSLSKLKEMVTSPGGTTAAALNIFADRDFSGIVEEATNAAYKRAKELGG